MKQIGGKAENNEKRNLQCYQKSERLKPVGKSNPGKSKKNILWTNIYSTYIQGVGLLLVY